MKLFLIRHGQTSFNLKKRYSGHTDCPLNKTGRMQAKKIGRCLKKHKIHKVYSSDLKRAEDFARLAFGHMPLYRSRQLREINFGRYEGLTAAQIAHDDPGFYASWIKSPNHISFPEGESFSDLKRRINRFIRHIYDKHRNKTIAVVSHAGPIKLILNDILRTKSFWDIAVDSSSLNIIEYKGRKKDIKVLNDTSFL